MRDIRNILVLTGARISAESGLAIFASYGSYAAYRTG